MTTEKRLREGGRQRRPRHRQRRPRAFLRGSGESRRAETIEKHPFVERDNQNHTMKWLFLFFREANSWMGVKWELEGSLMGRRLLYGFACPEWQTEAILCHPVAQKRFLGLQERASNSMTAQFTAIWLFKKRENSARVPRLPPFEIKWK